MPSGAQAHDFEVYTLEPSPDWCEELHRVAHPADVVELLPGRYPGGCDLTLGGDAALSEALLVYGQLPGETFIEADADGLSLRVSGEPTRLYQLQLEGRLDVVANNVTVDSSVLACLNVAPGVERFTLVFSEAGDIDLTLSDTVIRGNQLRSLTITAPAGLVADNVVHGDLHADNAVHRNLVLGNLRSTVEAHRNIVLGTTTAEGELFGNTLFGPVSGGADARNNLTVDAELGAGNLRCSDCLTDPDTLDVQPIGAALNAVLVDAPSDSGDFCGQSQTVVGAIAPVGVGWTAYDRDRFGCEPGLAPEVPPTPSGECPEPEPEPTRDVVLQPEPKGCASAAPTNPWSFAPRRRRNP